jgi:hypothetical protein
MFCQERNSKRRKYQWMENQSECMISWCTCRKRHDTMIILSRSLLAKSVKNENNE